MMKEVLAKLNENLGKEIRVASACLQKQLKLNEVHIYGGKLVLSNNVEIDIEAYNNIKILDENLISFHGNKLGTFLIAIK